MKQLYARFVLRLIRPAILLSCDESLKRVSAERNGYAVVINAGLETLEQEVRNA
jgi:hypothetical protein